MKPIYIRQGRPQHRKLPYVLLAIFFILITVILMAPTFIEAYINKTGSDQKGYSFRINDLRFSVLKGEILLQGLKVFNDRSSVNFAEAKKIVLNFDPLRIFDDKKVFSMQANSIDVLISKDFVDEIERVKNEHKEKIDTSLYLDKVDAKVNTINVQQIIDNKPKTILTLKDAQATLYDFGIGSINENTEFKIHSNIAEGGSIDLNGKTKLESNKTPWVIEGSMSKIPSAVLEKLAGDKLPVDIEKANINATIAAHSAGGKVEGEIVPDIKDFALSEDKDNGFLKRNLAKAANAIFSKVKEEKKEVSLKLPFTLKEDFKVDIPDTLQKLKEK
jgi:hypothetical protein